MKPPLHLHEYRRKRRFSGTPEPEPARLTLVPRPSRRRFCVQEHHAGRLHYDLRLEIEGVLKSWAVPKGPTLDPEVRRLAMATEDHPLEYLTFEGHIPEGNYGAGEVIVWDTGEYEPVGGTPPGKQWEQGHLKFRLHGKKLQGEFALVRMPARRENAEKEADAAPASGRDAWLLIKKHDDAQQFGDSAERHPGSVLKNRSRPAGPKLMAGEEPAKPTSRRGGRAERPARTDSAVPARPADGTAKPGSPARKRARAERQAPQPSTPPMLATLSDKPFSDDGWLFEIKWDGIRARAECRRGRVRLISRNGHDLTAQYPELQRFPANWTGVLDGEIVSLDAGGASSFHRLQQRMNLADAGDIAQAAARIPVDFYAFDLLVDGREKLGALPLIERKRRMAKLRWEPPWRYSDHIEGDGLQLYEQARRRGLEGVIAKRADSPYQAGRSRDWLKFKLQRRQEAVIVGLTPPQGSRTEFGALLLATFDPAEQRYRYAGRVGTGFDAATRRDILTRLRDSRRPAVELDGAGRGRSGQVRWVRPEQVAEVKFAEWTPAGLMRAPVFLGLRSDKAPQECVREGGGAGT